MDDDTPYEYQPPIKSGSFAEGAEQFQKVYKHNIAFGHVMHTSPEIVERVDEMLRQVGIDVLNFSPPAEDYLAFMEKAAYGKLYPGYYPWNIGEKSLEHFMAIQLLGLADEDIFVDIASEGSPLPEIAARLWGTSSYAQDIMYPEGVRGQFIGGDACRMPVQDCFFTKASLTCSFEHFEGDSDIRLFRELARVLKPGGRVCVAPLYLNTYAATLTDPRYSCSTKVSFDEDCVIHLVENWGNRHGRYYTPRTLIERLLTPVKTYFQFAIYSVSKSPLVTEGIYVRHVLVGEKID